jgi:hypothetical protein
LLGLHARRFEALHFPIQVGESLLSPGPTGLQPVQRQGLCHVGVDQALNLPLDLGAAPSQILAAHGSLLPAQPPLLGSP